MMVAFGLAALLLASIGIAGTLSNAVNRRTKEMGVRLALGAEPRSVRALVMADALRMTGLGLALGLVIALLGANLLQALLFEVHAHDPTVFLSVTGLLAGVAMASAYLPARRAARIDPCITLQEV